MPRPFLPSLLVLACLAVAAPQAALADTFPSLIKHTAILNPWTVTTTGGATKPGKCKIYDRMPTYDADNKIEFDPVGILDNAGDSFTFKRSTDYWLVYFPKLGAVRVELTFVKEGSKEKPTKLLVGGVNIKDTAEAMPTCDITNTNPKAKFNKKNFMKGLGAGIRREEAPFIILD